MTTTLNPVPMIGESSAPDLLEEMMWDRGLKMLYWHVDEPQRVDPLDPDPSAPLIAEFEVVWFNGRRHFRSEVTLDYDVIHALVGNDEVPAEMTSLALQQILENASEVHENYLSHCKDDETYAAGSDRELSDCDLLRGASLVIGGEWGLLLEAVGKMVETLPQGLSFAHPKARVASIAVQIAWDIL